LSGKSSRNAETTQNSQYQGSQLAGSGSRAQIPVVSKDRSKTVNKSPNVARSANKSKFKNVNLSQKNNSKKGKSVLAPIQSKDVFKRHKDSLLTQSMTLDPGGSKASLDYHGHTLMANIRISSSDLLQSTKNIILREQSQLLPLAKIEKLKLKKKTISQFTDTL